MGRTVALRHSLGMMPVCQTELYLWSSRVVVVGLMCRIMAYGMLSGPGKVSLQTVRADFSSRMEKGTLYISVLRREEVRGREVSLLIH